MDRLEVAARIAEARQSLGMTQQQLAEKLNVTNKAVSKWERGINLPDVALLLPLSRILGLSMEELLEDGEGFSGPSGNCFTFGNREQREQEIEMSSRPLEQLYIDLADCKELSPYVFGHNLEHTRACVIGGLSAQLLRNRKFAGKPSKNEGCAAEWFSIGERVFYITDGERYTRHNMESKMRRINEMQALEVQNLAPGKVAGFGQRDLPIRAGMIYEMRVVSKAFSNVEVLVQLTCRDGKKVYAEQKLQLQPDDWHTSEFLLQPNADDDTACLRVTFTDGARIIFGAMSMLPQGHFHGMRRDVVEKLKELGPTLLRWPGGNFAGEYRWMDGLLPVDMRAPLQSYTEDETHPYTHGYDSHEIGIDEFIALCREVGAEPFVTINLVWYTPQQSADWVEYCNGSVDTPYGRLRAERGFAEPYNVTFWSLGNEIGYEHMEGPSTPENYARLASAQAEAMLAVSPDLKLFSSGTYPSREWGEKSARALSDKAKYVSLHRYEEVKMNFTTPEELERTYTQLVALPEKYRSLAYEMRECLGDGLHISYDEWNYWYAWYRPSSVIEGLYAAGMLHMLMQESGPLDMPVCCYFQPVGEGAMEIKPYEVSLTGIGQVMSVMKAHEGGKLCRVDGAGDLEAVATVNSGVLTVTLLNRRFAEEKRFVLNECGALLQAKVLEAPDLLPHSHFEEKPLAVHAGEEGLQVTLPPHSFAMLQLRV